MRSNLLKCLALTCLVSLQLLTSQTAMAKQTRRGNGGAIAGGGGDYREIKVNDIRHDILQWINNGGAANLNLPSDLSYGEYVSRMKEILTPLRVVISFSDEVIKVKGEEKTCQGYVDHKSDREHMKCNRQLFDSTPPNELYRVIHHEYAGLILVEKNRGAASDYFISSQVSEYVDKVEIYRLGMKKAKKTKKANTKRYLTLSEAENAFASSARVFDPKELSGKWNLVSIATPDKLTAMMLQLNSGAAFSLTKSIEQICKTEGSDNICTYYVANGIKNAETNNIFGIEIGEMPEDIDNNDTNITFLNYSAYSDTDNMLRIKTDSNGKRTAIILDDLFNRECKIRESAVFLCRTTDKNNGEIIGYEEYAKTN